MLFGFLFLTDRQILISSATRRYASYDHHPTYSERDTTLPASSPTADGA